MMNVKSVLTSSSVTLHSSSEREGIRMTGTFTRAHSLFLLLGTRLDTKNKCVHTLTTF